MRTRARLAVLNRRAPERAMQARRAAAAPALKATQIPDYSSLRQLQASAGNQAVARLFDGRGMIQRKVVTIESEQVEIHSTLGKVSKRGEKERAEAEKILKDIKATYGVTVSTSKLIEGIKQQYDKVPAKVTKALQARKWRMAELRALATALSHYAPIMGAKRGGSSRKDTDQEVVYVGKTKQAIDTNQKAGKLDTTTLGEYFKGKKVMGLFKASEGYHDVFKDEQQELVGTFIHEIAHGVLAYAYDDFVACSGGYWTDQDTESGAKGVEKPPTEYGQKNAREDMCDTASLFFIEPSRLDKFPKRKAFMEKLGKDWVPSLKEAPPQLGGVGKDGEAPKEGEAPKVEQAPKPELVGAPG